MPITNSTFIMDFGYDYQDERGDTQSLSMVLRIVDGVAWIDILTSVGKITFPGVMFSEISSFIASNMNKGASSKPILRSPFSLSSPSSAVTETEYDPIQSFNTDKEEAVEKEPEVEIRTMNPEEIEKATKEREKAKEKSKTNERKPIKRLD